MFRERKKRWSAAALLVFAVGLFAAEKIKPYDLALDETRGGNTLREHVGLPDAALFERLKQQPSLPMTSSYFDRATAERAVGASLAKSALEFVKWMRLPATRGNLTLRYSGSDRNLGHCIARGDRAVKTCNEAVVILKASATGFIVLTSYPDFDAPGKGSAR